MSGYAFPSWAPSGRVPFLVVAASVTVRDDTPGELVAGSGILRADRWWPRGAAIFAHQSETAPLVASGALEIASS